MPKFISKFIEGEHHAYPMQNTDQNIYMVPTFLGGYYPLELTPYEETLDFILDSLHEMDLTHLTKYKVNEYPLVFVMVDEKEVFGLHRRSGVHIDGYWNIIFNDGSDFVRPWNPEESLPTKGDDELLVLLTNKVGSIAYKGEWNGIVGEGGDASNVDLTNLTNHVIKPNRLWIGDVYTLHESIPSTPGRRGLIRINLPLGERAEYYKEKLT